MFRGLVLAVMVLVLPQASPAQATGGLHISVRVDDGGGQALPVPRYRLQISDNPASGPPRRVITSLEGLIDVRLAPGNYTVESERPVVIGGRSYRWTVVVDVVAGRDADLVLSNQNAEVLAPEDAPDSEAMKVLVDAPSLLARWQDSLVAVWTATTRGSGVLIDAGGLIVADQQVIGTATTVEVQLSPAVKVAGTVVVSDATRGLALVSVHPSVAAKAKVLPLQCDKADAVVVDGQQIAALEAPLMQVRGVSEGFVESVLPNMIDADLVASPGGSGGPAFASDGSLLGITTLVPEREGQRTGRTRIVRVVRVCEAVASAARSISAMPQPSAVLLPVESMKPPSSISLSAGVPGRAANPAIYRASSSNFDVTLLTPVQLRAATTPADFGNWQEYVDGMPQVLLIRVTPKFAEGFWTKVARGAAMTQGVSIPSIKRPKSGFASMRVLCGDTAIVPVHPFRLEHPLEGTDTLVEGLYAFEPGALTPSCGSVTLQLFSEKEPGKADVVALDPRAVAQISQDFAMLR